VPRRPSPAEAIGTRMTAQSILNRLSPIEERELESGATLLDAVATARGPFVLRGLASSWGLVAQSASGDRAVTDYLRRFAGDVPVHASMLPPEHQGRVFYQDDLGGLNFEQVETRLAALLDQLDALTGADDDPTIYLGSTAIDYCLPGFAEENRIDLGDVRATVRLWLGTRHRVAAHYDVLENIAVVGAGRRRFILIPPEQLPNLYVGPLDFTPAGQPVSMVDFERPDLARYPRFEAALDQALGAVLEPGDAIYVPSTWWHHVEGLERINILVNHWWYPGPDYMGAPLDALMHAILSIRELPAPQRDAWRLFFDHYVFRADPERVAGHLPEDRRGILGPIDADVARRIRMLLRNKLNK
jgi:hypothetical protein